MTEQERGWIVRNFERTQSVRQVRMNWPFDSPIPRYCTVKLTATRFAETNSIKDRKHSGRPRSALSVMNGNILEEIFSQAPQGVLSLKKASRELDIPTTTIWRRLDEAGMKSYHAVWVQALKCQDYASR